MYRLDSGVTIETIRHEKSTFTVGSDQINVSGYEVRPREVEEMLHEHEAVREAAVIGIPTSTAATRSRRSSASDRARR